MSDLLLDRERTDTGIGDGGTVWNRVTAAASTLTISVSKAWAANVSIFYGEGEVLKGSYECNAHSVYRNTTWTGIKVDQGDEGISYLESSGSV